MSVFVRKCNLICEAKFIVHVFILKFAITLSIVYRKFNRGLDKDKYLMIILG